MVVVKVTVVNWSTIIEIYYLQQRILFGFFLAVLILIKRFDMLLMISYHNNLLHFHFLILILITMVLLNILLTNPLRYPKMTLNFPKNLPNFYIFY